MIEQRAVLLRDLKFQGGFKLEQGTIVYVRETDNGWLGKFYEPKGSGHAFALDPDQFSPFISPDTNAAELVIMPDPPEPPEAVEERQAMERRQIESRIERHQKEADELCRLLEEMRLMN